MRVRAQASAHIHARADTRAGTRAQAHACVSTHACRRLGSSATTSRSVGCLRHRTVARTRTCEPLERHRHRQRLQILAGGGDLWTCGDISRRIHASRSCAHGGTCMRSLTRSLTHPLTHSLTHSRTHARTHSLTHSLTHPPTHSLTHSHTRPHPRPDPSTVCTGPLRDWLMLCNLANSVFLSTPAQL